MKLETHLWIFTKQLQAAAFFILVFLPRHKIFDVEIKMMLYPWVIAYVVHVKGYDSSKKKKIRAVRKPSQLSKIRLVYWSKQFFSLWILHWFGNLFFKKKLFHEKILRIYRIELNSVQEKNYGSRTKLP